MERVRDQFRKIADALSAKAELAGGIQHAATVGQLREIVVRDFLIPHLPRHFQVMSGKIIDSTGLESLQQDCVIVDTRLPLIDVGSSSTALIIAESVVATVEVKSYLDKGELESAMESSVRTKTLTRRGQLTYAKGPAIVKVPVPFPILTYVFAFDGSDPETLGGHMNDFAWKANRGSSYSADQITDAVCILNKGVILNEPRMPTIVGSIGTLPKLTDIELTWIRLTHDALFRFYKRLCSDLTYLRLTNIDLDPYFSGSELL